MSQVLSHLWSYISDFLSPPSYPLHTILVGTYNSQIIALRFQAPHHLSVLHTTSLSEHPWTNSNPSWIERFHRSANRLLVADESGHGRVLVAKILEQGGVEFVDAENSRGEDPSYVGSTRDGNWAFGVNYSGGSVMPIPLRGADFGPTTHQNIIKFEGKSVNVERQEMSHPHHLQEHPITGTVFIPDLGTDEIHELGLNEDGSQWILLGSTKVTVGSGPRHIRFTADGKYAYLVTEMGNSLIVYDVIINANGPTTLTALSQHSILPPGTDGSTMGGGEILLTKDEKTLIISNRNEGHSGGDALALFNLKSPSEVSEPKFWRTGGQHIRGMELDPEDGFLVVGNMNSAEVVMFELVEGEEGKELEERARVNLEEGVKPTSFVWI